MAEVGRRDDGGGSWEEWVGVMGEWRGVGEGEDREVWRGVGGGMEWAAKRRGWG